MLSPQPLEASTPCSLAPAYDLLSTRLYPEPARIPGMFVNGVRDIDQVTAADLVAEAAAWGMPTARAQTRLDALLTRLSAAIHAATGEVETPRDLVELVTSRVARLAG